MKDLSAMSERELLRASSEPIAELRRRGVVKTGNSIGDYTEWLVCNGLKLQAQGNSKAGYDAIDHQGNRYQIKGRRSDGSSVQFSTIRNLNQRGFDFLIAVAFHEEDYSVRFAVKIPYEEVPNFARWQEYVNGYNLTLTDKRVGQALNQGEVKDIRHRLA